MGSDDGKLYAVEVATGAVDLAGGLLAPSRLYRRHRIVWRIVWLV